MPRRTIARGVLALVVALHLPPSAPAQESAPRIPLMKGLSIVSTLQSPDGDRDNVVDILAVDSSGVNYVWHLLEYQKSGDTVSQQFERRVRANDLAGAPRLDPVFASGDRERPGYTAFTISSATYAQLRDGGSVPYSITTLESASGGIFEAVAGTMGAGGTMGQRARYRGTLVRAASDPEPFPLLVDGKRVRVPALRLTGDFSSGLRHQSYELRVLADSAHPLLLKTVVGGHVFQVTAINFPPEPAAKPAAGVTAAPKLERELDTACRIELPGVYFAFNSATLDPSSDRALAAVAGVVARHREWRMTVEGHTDSVGGARSNQTLSEHRAEAVRLRLAERHGVDTRAWRAVGYGASRPLEPNATIEGRARNRRVELVRDCGR